MSLAHDSHTEAQSGSRHPLRTAVLGATSLCLAMGGLSLAGAPAQAAESATHGACTVTAVQPRVVGLTGSGKKLVAYPIDVHCTKSGMTVHIRQQLMEDDPNFNDVQKSWFVPQGTPVKPPKGERVTVDPLTVHRLVNWDPEGTEEVYHSVKFIVEGNDVPPKEITVHSRNRSIDN